MQNIQTTIAGIRLEVTNSPRFNDAQRTRRMQLLDALERSVLLSPGLQGKVLKGFLSFDDKGIHRLHETILREHRRFQEAASSPDLLLTGADISPDDMRALELEIRKVSESAESSSDASQAEQALDQA